MGCDVIRARYRAERRAAIREIIIGNLLGSFLHSYIQGHTEKVIPAEHRKEFIQDIMEDLEYMDESRIVGTGVTPDELSKWLSLYKQS